MQKRGISTVVVSLIMVILVLVAVTIIWFVLKDVIEGGAEQVNLGTKCLEVDVKTTKLECTGTNNDVCDVTVTRGSGGDEITGIKLIFTNSTGEKNYVHDVLGNIASLEAKTESGISTGIANTDNVEVVVYFEDASGNEHLCSVTSSFSS